MNSMEGEFGGGCRDLHTVRAETMRQGEQEVSAAGGLGASEPGESRRRVSQRGPAVGVL